MNDNNSFLTLFLAPVAVYLEDDSVSEILINGPKQVYIERRGRLEEVEALGTKDPSLPLPVREVCRGESKSGQLWRAKAEWLFSKDKVGFMPCLQG